MKKLLLSFITICTILSVSCNNGGNKETPKTDTTTVKTTSTRGLIPIIPQPYYDIQVGQVSPNAVTNQHLDYNTGNLWIKGSTPANINRYSFTFDKIILVDYINRMAALSKGIQKIHFFPAYDNNRQTRLLACAVNNTLGHSYDSAQTIHYCLRDTTIAGFNPPAYPKLDVGHYTDITIDMPDTVLFDTASAMVTGYQNLNDKSSINRTALSFLVNVNSLLLYLQDTNVRYLQVYFGTDNYRLTLVLVGLAANGDVVVIKGANNRRYILEHCMPCPHCNVSNEGYTLAQPN